MFATLFPVRYVVLLALLTVACSSPTQPSPPAPVIDGPRLVVRVLRNQIPVENHRVTVNSVTISTNVIGECDWLIRLGQSYVVTVETLPTVTFIAEGPITWTFYLPIS